MILALGAAGCALHAQSAPAIRFEAAPGPGFILQNSPTPEKYLAETMTGGLAVFDYNNDGRPDLLFANGADLPSFRKTDRKYWNRLYRNDGNWRFTDVTETAGLAGEGYAFGAAVADFDGDRKVDVFVAAIPAGRLYRNRGDGTFEDVTARAGIRTGPWTVAAGWLDYDRDGRPDLFAANYLDWSPTNNPWCGDKVRDLRMYCHPGHFRATPNQLYRNRGDGTFEDVSARSGIARHPGKAMSVAFADYDLNGYPDIFVTNDAIPNSLFRNRGDGTFEEVAMNAGVALATHGRPISSMSAEFRDYNNDGLPDILVTALAGESFPLFRNAGKGFFEDAADQSRLAGLVTRISGWCGVIADFDNDGRKDIFSANAHVNDRISDISSDRYTLANSVFRNRDGNTFEDLTGANPGLKSDVHAHRGCAVADFDGDGRLDVAVSVLGGAAELWRNTSPGKAHWVDVDLRGPRGNSDAIGAVVRIGAQTNERTSSAGYSSASLIPVHFGLGASTRIPLIEIRWPDGFVERLENAQADRVILVEEPEQKAR